MNSESKKMKLCHSCDQILNKKSQAFDDQGMLDIITSDLWEFTLYAVQDLQVRTWQFGNNLDPKDT